MKTPGGSAWTVTFAPVNGQTSGFLDLEAPAAELVIWVSIDRVDEISFATPYTLGDIETFRDAAHDDDDKR